MKDFGLKYEKIEHVTTLSLLLPDIIKEQI